MRRFHPWTALAAAAILAVTLGSCGQPVASPAPTSAGSDRAVGAVLSWKGYNWNVKSGSGLGPGGPNGNSWSASNVFVDANGWLHLRIARIGGVWTCAELWTTANLPPGTYQWQVIGSLDTLDPNVVFGLFPYGPPDIGTDGTNEIDVEFTRWGNPAENNGWWTVYPSAGTVTGQDKFRFSLDGTYTTSRFTWTRSSVSYWFMGGHQPAGTTANVLRSWVYAPTGAVRVPQQAMPLHMNLWLFQGRAPSDGQPVEIIIKDFTRS